VLTKGTLNFTEIIHVAIYVLSEVHYTSKDFDALSSNTDLLPISSI
jgi:hypothetical protein